MEKIISYIRGNLEMIKKIMFPAVVIMAMIVFWIFGGEEDLTVEDTGSMEAMETQVQEEVDETEYLTGDIYVDIGGEVNQPGVYRIPAGTRLFQVVEEAGGLKETADIDSINQAEAVTDGQKIIIGSRDENSPYYTGTAVKPESAASSGGSAVRQTADGFKVNLNRATLSDLQMIPGVGPSTAQKILDYRESVGKFGSISDLKNISGIGEKTYDNLKDYIEV
ncbi:MAG: helix-hairpin-helix domain-containing protein [Firmicutes bacterium]|nr:helix-hairpin-helix domain-containing protein [Bacillota bacterium]